MHILILNFKKIIFFFFQKSIMSESKNEINQEMNKGFFKVKPGSSTYSESSSNALFGFFCYSALMFTLPLLSFFGSKHFFENYWDLSPTYQKFAPAIISVLIVNVIIICYVIKAFKEEAKENKAKSD